MTRPRVLPGVISHEITPGGLGAECWEPGPPLLCPVPGSSHGAMVLLLRSWATARAGLSREQVRSLSGVDPDQAVGGVTLQSRNGLEHLDSPQAQRARRACNGLWRPAAVEPLRALIRDEAERLVALAAGLDDADLAAMVALPLARHMIALACGCSLATAAELAALSFATTGALLDTPADHPPAAAAWDRLYALIERLLDQGMDCLVTRTALALEDAGLTYGEVVAAVGTVVNGLPTIIPALIRSLLWLMERPPVMLDCQADPGLIPGAVNDALFEAAHFNFGFVGVTTDDTQGVPAGTAVCPVIHAAHVDRAESGERVRGDAGLAYGGGIHRCLGEHLASMVLQEAFRAVCALLDGWVLVSASAWERGTMAAPAAIMIERRQS